MRFVCLALLTLCVACDFKLTLDKNTLVKIYSTITGLKTGTSVQPIIGANSSDSSKGQNASLIVDFGFDGIFMPNLGTSTYGINCEESLACSVYGQPADCSYKNGEKVTCLTAGTILRFADIKLIDKSISQVHFQLFTSSASWVKENGENGLFGLSPQSKFWNFLLSTYSVQPGQSYIEVSISYKLEKLNSSEIDGPKSFLALNGRLGVNDPILQEVDSVGSVWTYKNILFNDTNAERRTDVCIDNTADIYFLVTDAQVLKDNLNRKLCGNGKCTNINSDVTRLESLFVTVGSDNQKFKVEITPQEYVRFEKDGVATLLIDDISTSFYCSASQAKDAVGRLFLTKTEFVVRVSGFGAQPTFQIGFNETEYPDKSLYFYILLGLGCLVLVVIIGIFIYNAVKKNIAKKGNLEGDYAGSQDVHN